MKLHLLISLSLLALVVSACSDKPDIAPQKQSQNTSIQKPVSLTKGDQLWADKKIEEAIIEYKRVIKEEPDNKIAYQRLANLYLSNNKTCDAVEAYQEAILHDPENPKLFAGMSIAYLHQGQYSMAKAMAKEAIRIDPDMDNVKKIIEYTDKKEEVIEQAQKAMDHSAISKKMPPHGQVEKQSTSTQGK